MLNGDRKGCTDCGKRLPISSFYTKENGKYLSSYCKACDLVRVTRRQQRRSGEPQYEAQKARYKISTNRHHKASRAANERREHWIWQDTRRNDRKFGRRNDLTKVTIREMIEKGCAYCEISPDDCKMTLDRIDNSKGHLVSNVVPSCPECNLTRGNMPYEVWLRYMVPGMREARKNGALNGWERRSWRRRRESNSQGLV
jgi:hypothetical protein